MFVFAFERSVVQVSVEHASAEPFVQLPPRIGKRRAA